MSLKKIILIGSLATVGLGIAGTAYVAKKVRAKRNEFVDSDGVPLDFEDALLKQLEEFVSQISDADGSTDSDENEDEDKDNEVELDNSDSDVGEDESIIELNNFQASALGIATKPLGSAVRLNGNIYIFVSQYVVNDEIFRVYKLLSQHQGH